MEVRQVWVAAKCFFTDMDSVAQRLAGEKVLSRMADGGSSIFEGEHEDGVADG
jgi:hypothetical protein